jgi:hypothetical protein
MTNQQEVDIERTTPLYQSYAMRRFGHDQRNRVRPKLAAVAVIALMFLMTAVCATAQTPASANAEHSNDARDGQHDFDFEIGTWKTELKRLLHPLSGSNEWVECHGTSVVRKVWDGRANLVELTADCPGGHFEGLNLRLYNPVSHQWSLNFANASSGTLGQPTVGEFKNGRGEFYDQETFKGRAILVRFVIIPVSADVCRFEQSFSDDGGKTWELNWVATDTRIKPADSAR